MSELRQDPITGRWVIVAGNRADRPEEYRRAPVIRVELDCPFCRGHEHATAREVAWYGSEPTAPDQWEVRVVRNKYPALAVQGDGSPMAGDIEAEPRTDDEHPLLISRPGYGRHEVVIESPRHVESFSELTDDQAFWTFAAYRDRIRAHRRDSALAAASVFKNVGPEGGASLVHAHSQVLSLPSVPETLARELSGAGDFFNRYQHCVYCAMVERERKLGARVVAETERMLALCPYASRFAYETWILPRDHRACFEETEDSLLREAALLLKQVIWAVEVKLDRPAYNYFLHTAPFDSTAGDHYHWHFEFFPRISKAAGFEWSSGWHLNTVPPESAASLLRTALGNRS